jgi:hypothetical protein
MTYRYKCHRLALHGQWEYEHPLSDLTCPVCKDHNLVKVCSHTTYWQEWSSMGGQSFAVLRYKDCELGAPKDQDTCKKHVASVLERNQQSVRDHNARIDHCLDDLRHNSECLSVESLDYMDRLLNKQRKHVEPDRFETTAVRVCLAHKHVGQACRELGAPWGDIKNQREARLQEQFEAVFAWLDARPWARTVNGVLYDLHEGDG